MTQALPRDILKKFERRWSARATQVEGFHVAADRLKKDTKAAVERPPLLADQPAPPTQKSVAKRN